MKKKEGEIASEKRFDSSIRSDGAETFVQGYIMLELGYPTALASRNMPGYDVIAQNLKNRRSCKIQVKYRSAENSDGFHFINFGFDIGVLIVGNIGKVAQSDQTKLGETDFFVFPQGTIKRNSSKNSKGEFNFPNPNRKKYRKKFERYKNAWVLISKFLDKK